MVRVAAATRIAAGGHPCCTGVFCVSPQPLLLSRCCWSSPPAARSDGTGTARTAATADCRSEAAAAVPTPPIRPEPLPPPAAGQLKVGVLLPLSGAERRTGQGNARSGAACAVRDGRRKADPGAARHGRAGRRRGGGALGDRGRRDAASRAAARRRSRGGPADRGRGQGQCHRLRDADPGGRRQCLSDGVPAASGSGARGVVRPRARVEPVRRAGAEHGLRTADDRCAARHGRLGRRDRRPRSNI